MIRTEFLLLYAAAFCAGFIDAVVGGGGIIQIPAALLLLPGYPVATVIGTTKIPSFCGTSIAAYQYSRHVEFNVKRLTIMATVACVSAITGSVLLTLVSNSFMKPLLVVVLTVVAVYTYWNKNFGIHTEKDLSPVRELTYVTAISICIGFYDGFIGPGSGSLFILGLITLLGYDFLRASANAKFLNLSTNIGSITFFLLTGRIIYMVALPMALCNAAGGYAGAKVAILKGNAFIRIFFLVIVTATLLRFGYEVFF